MKVKMPNPFSYVGELITLDFTISHQTVDDSGNPPPNGMYGDMRPVWRYGRWWACHAAMIEYGKKIAQDRMAYAGL